MRLGPTLLLSALLVPLATSEPARHELQPRGKPAECVLAQKWATGIVQTVAGALPCASR